MPTNPRGRFETFMAKIGRGIDWFFSNILRILGILALVAIVGAVVYYYGKSQGSVATVEKVVEPKDYRDLKALAERAAAEKAEAVRRAEEVTIQARNERRSSSSPTSNPVVSAPSAETTSNPPATASAPSPQPRPEPAVYRVAKPTSLIVAIKNGDTQTALELLKEGKGLDERDGEYQGTPLHWACFKGQKDVVLELIAQGANLDAINKNGETPLMQAIENRDSSYEIVSELLLAGAQPGLIDTNGKTALYWAAESGDTNICRILVDSYGCRADIKRPCNLWRDVFKMAKLTPLSIARKNGHSETARYLESVAP